MKSHLAVLFAVLGLASGFAAARADAVSRAFSIGRAPTSAVVLEIPADYLAADLSIRVEEGDWMERLDATEIARRALAQAASAAGFVLHVERPVTLRPEYGKSSFSSAADPFMQPGADLRLLARLDPASDTLALLRRMKALVDGVKLPRKTSVGIGDLRLALENPESHRPRLLAAIKAHLEKTRDGLGANMTAAVSRLDTPLLLSQLDERTVGVFLPFEIAYSPTATP